MGSVTTALWGSRRVIGVAILVSIGLLLVLVRPVHAWLLLLFDDAEALIRQGAAWGMVAFVLLAAVSAMIAFVSSAVLVPVAIHIWGPVVCFVLLWVGWFTGGLAGYAIGRFLGRPAVELFVRRDSLERYERWAHQGRSLIPILIVQLAIPSDLASYLFGLVRCRFRVFAAALALAEIPYALGAVYLGASFLARRILPLALLGLAGVLISAWAVHRLHGAPARERSDPDLPQRGAARYQPASSEGRV